MFVCQTRDCLNDDSSLERGLVGDSVGGMVVVVVEVGNETAEVEDVLVFKAFGGGALRACRRKPDRLEVWLWMAGWQWFHGTSSSVVFPIACLTLTVDSSKLIVEIYPSTFPYLYNT